jgi:hypothetical protein
MLLTPDVLPHRFLVPTHGENKVPLGPKVLTNEIALALSIHPGQIIALFPSMYPTTCDTAYFGGIEISMCT